MLWTAKIQINFKTIIQIFNSIQINFLFISKISPVLSNSSYSLRIIDDYRWRNQIVKWTRMSFIVHWSDPQVASSNSHGHLHGHSPSQSFFKVLSTSCLHLSSQSFPYVLPSVPQTGLNNVMQTHSPHLPSLIFFKFLNLFLAQSKVHWFPEIKKNPKMYVHGKRGKSEYLSQNKKTWDYHSDFRPLIQKSELVGKILQLFWKITKDSVEHFASL